MAHNIPTRPKRIQYSAANIGKGIDANTAPNLPAINREGMNHVCHYSITNDQP